MPNMILINVAINTMYLAFVLFAVIAGKETKEVHVPFEYQIITECDCKPCHKYIFPVSDPFLQFN